METKESLDVIEQEIEIKKKPDELSSMFAGMLTNINYKLYIFIFFLFIFITSDIFVDKILNKFSDSVEHRIPTSKGTFIQALFLCLFIFILDLVIKNELI